MYYGTIFFPLPKLSIDLAGCAADCDWSKAIILRSAEPKHVECPFGTRVFQVAFSKAEPLMDAAFLATLPSDMQFLSVAFYSDETV